MKLGSGEVVTIYFLIDMISQWDRQANASSDSDEDSIGVRYSIFGLDFKFSMFIDPATSWELNYKLCS